MSVPAPSVRPTIVRSTAMPAQTPQVPVAIVGAGACGLVAAIVLRNAGLECVLLERDAQPSGSTALSSGLIPAAGTSMQRAAALDDSAAQFAADITAKTRGRAAAHLVTAYAGRVGPVIDMLASMHGIEFVVQDGFLYPGHSVRRMHTVPEMTGVALMAQLERAALDAGADILTEATVRELWVADANRVLGVGYQRPDGKIEHLGCDALILACNGFGGNPAMVRELLPDMRDALFAGHAGNDGSAIAWGRGLGARLADLDGYQGHGSWAVPQGTLITWALMMEGGMQLNVRGQRFHDETHGYSEASVQVLAQPGGVAWDVFDAPILALARTFPDFRDAEAAGALKRCDDARSLATLIGCDAGTLAATLAHPQAVPGSIGTEDRVFARPLRAPYYAIKVTGALFHTQGGLDIDAQCRVLDLAGQPFPNLLAAGGAARGVSGDAVWGYLSGNGLLSAVAGGAIAAATASHLVHSS